MSDTPLTDAAEYDTGLGDGQPDMVLPADKARDLERKLTIARKFIRTLSALTPEKPKAITYEGGWRILDYVQDEVSTTLKEIDGE